MTDDDIVQHVVVLGTNTQETDYETLSIVPKEGFLAMTKKGLTSLYKEFGKEAVYGCIINVSLFGRKMKVPSIPEIKSFFALTSGSLFFVLFDKDFTGSTVNPVMEAFNLVYESLNTETE